MKSLEQIISDLLDQIKAVPQDGGAIKTICDDGPLLNLIRDFHDRELPRDWVFDKTLNLLVRLGDSLKYLDDPNIEALRDELSQAADSEVSIYNDELLQWVRPWHYLINEYVEQGLIDPTATIEERGFIGLVSAAQFYKLDSMGHQLIDFINEIYQGGEL